MSDNLAAEAEALGIKVDSRWSEGTLRRKVEEARTARGNVIEQPAEVPFSDGHDKPEPSPLPPPELPRPVAMFPVRLLKNYKPAGEYNVIEAAPPPFPGAHFEHKLWAGTLVELPRDEVRRMVDNVHRIVETRRDAQGHPLRDENNRALTRVIEKRVPLAEIRTEDAIPTG